MRELELALRAYPRAVRERDGDLLLATASDLAADGSVVAEALGLVRGGLVMRAGRLGRVPWDDALRRLGLPLAIAFLAVSVAGLRPRLPGSEWPGVFFSLAILGSTAAVAGFALHHRRTAILGALALLVVCVGDLRFPGGHLYASVDSARGDDYGYGAAFSEFAASIGAALLLLVAALRVDAHRPRRLVRDLAWTAAVCIAACFVPFFVSIGSLTVNQPGLFAVAFGLGAAGFGLWHGRVVAALLLLVIGPQAVVLLEQLVLPAGFVAFYGELLLLPVAAWLLVRGCAESPGGAAAPG